MMVIADILSWLIVESLVVVAKLTDQFLRIHRFFIAFLWKCARGTEEPISFMSVWAIAHSFRFPATTKASKQRFAWAEICHAGREHNRHNKKFLDFAVLFLSIR
jgi:hypothetical protein